MMAKMLTEMHWSFLDFILPPALSKAVRSHFRWRAPSQTKVVKAQPSTKRLLSAKHCDLRIKVRSNEAQDALKNQNYVTRVLESEKTVRADLNPFWTWSLLATCFDWLPYMGVRSQLHSSSSSTMFWKLPKTRIYVYNSSDSLNRIDISHQQFPSLDAIARGCHRCLDWKQI